MFRVNLFILRVTTACRDVYATGNYITSFFYSTVHIIINNIRQHNTLLLHKSTFIVMNNH